MVEIFQADYGADWSLPWQSFGPESIDAGALLVGIHDGRTNHEPVSVFFVIDETKCARGIRQQRYLRSL
jgi:hypothetical protein